MTKVAVVGSGYWGKNLVRNFNELGALITICDNNIDGVVKSPIYCVVIFF